MEIYNPNKKQEPKFDKSRILRWLNQLDPGQDIVYKIR